MMGLQSRLHGKLLLFSVVVILLVVLFTMGLTRSDDLELRYLRLLRYCRRSTSSLLQDFLELQENDKGVLPLTSSEKKSIVQGFDLTLGVIDASHKYKSHTFSVVGSDWSTLGLRHVCLATHTTLDHMTWLTHTASTWTHCISVAIFAPDVEFYLTVAFISYLHKCYPDVRKRVSFHLVYPLERTPKMDQLRLPAELTNDCSRNVSEVLNDLLLWRSPMMMQEWRKSLPYPQNLLRNIARKTCPTEFVLCPDVDMLPSSPHLADSLENFLLNNTDVVCPKCAFVLPVYEIHDSVSSLPVDKTQLIGLVSKKLARPFHIKVFTLNQGNSKLSVWEKQPASPTLGVSHPASNYSFWYEPVHVSRGDNPLFDERFVGYGNTRNSQVYEMFAQGWKFHVLNNAFLVHSGFQDTSNYSSYRIDQAKQNLIRMKDFVREMALRYDKDPLKLLAKFPKKNTTMLILKRKEPKLSKK